MLDRENPSPLGDFPRLHPHKEKSAMKLIGKSSSWGSKQRMRDYDAVAEGKQPEGPIFSVDSNGLVVYFHEDLVTWLRSRYKRITEVPPKKGKSNLPNVLNSVDIPTSAA
jgi:hypothetical protein